MNRATSNRAYREIKRSGLLSRMRWRVYRTVFHHGPLTAHELDNHLASPEETKTSYHKRLSELQRVGVCRVVGERPCSITGRNALLWDVTDALPTKYQKPQTRAEHYRAVIVGEISRHEAAGRDRTARRLRCALKEIDRSVG
jgi:hypothetical protein